MFNLFHKIMSDYTRIRHEFTKGCLTKLKECFISKFDHPQCEFAHILPLTICSNLGFDNMAGDFNNGLNLNPCLHITFELENSIPKWTLKRVGEIELYTTQYKLITLEDGRNRAEKRYKDKIFEINSNKAPYLDLHYKIFCYHNEITPDQNITNFKGNYFKYNNFFLKYKNMIENGKKVIKRKPEDTIDNNSSKKKCNTNGHIKGDIWQVKKICGKKLIKGKKHYLVDWDGHDADGNEYEKTWIESKQILNKDLIKDFEKRR
jgi:hypothetical protein